MNAMTRSWDELSKKFLTRNASSPDFDSALKGIGDLCGWLSVHATDWPLFGFSSMQQLIITQVEPQFPLHDSIQRLVVEAMPNGKVQFDFKQPGIRKPNNHRSVRPHETVLQMCKFLKQTGWVKPVPFPTPEMG